MAECSYRDRGGEEVRVTAPPDTSVLANFRQLAGQRPVRIHPLVARLIEPVVLEKLKGAGKS